MRGKTHIFAPALLCLAIPCLAQSPDPNGNSKPASQDSTARANPAPEKRKTKKVWTNDDIGKSVGGVSIVGEGNAPAADPSKKPASPNANDEARQQQIDECRKQLNEIRAQIEAIDKRILQLKSFKGDNTSPSGGINIHQGYDMVPIEDQVKQLQVKKKQLQAKMDDLEAEARKNGITSDDLR
jgi:hypothetical protein